ncbi:MAG TPA: hypothetical protein DEA08_39575, partial [Planctomycetes bacterium]|nr:hypothetical protein [Planctomycetota bacterium]
TPAYMSPEQARGEVRSIGPGADIYSLGATLYDLLTERPPFADLPPIQLLLSVANLEPAPPSAHRAEIDPALDAIVLRCLAKQPAERYASMEALAADLEGYLREGASGVQAYAAARRPTRWPLALGALGLLVPLLAVVVALGEERGAESAAPGAGASPRVAGAASPAPRAQLAPAAVAPPEGELLGTLDSEGELLVQARAGDASLLFSLSGPPGAEVEIEGGGALRRVRCEAGWATPAQIVRSPSSYQPLQVGTYRLTLAPGESRPVQVGFQRLKKKTRAISVEPFAVFPPVELCLEDPERRESATKLLDQLRTVLQLRRSGKRVAPPPGLFKLLGELREAEGGRLFGLFEAVFGAYRTTLRPGPEEYAPAQELAIELLDDFPDVLAVRWHAAQGLLARQRYAEAAASFARGLELAPQRFELREGQLRSLLLAGQREEAYLAAEQVIALAPGSWDTQGWHALASYAVGRADAKAAERLMVALDKRRKVERLVGWLTQLDALFATDPAPAGVAELARIYLTRAARYMGGAYDAQPVLGWQALARLRAVQLLQGVEPARRLWKISPQAAKGDAEARARYAALGEELGVAK